MRIIITGCRKAPSWDMVQSLLRDVTRDEKGVLVRINRKDGGVDYQGLGEYELSFRTSHGQCEPVDFVAY